MFQNLEGNSPVGAMRGAWGCGRGASRLATAKRRLLQAAAVGAVTLPGAFTSPDVATGNFCSWWFASVREMPITGSLPP
jgi:hypothetical protein